MSHVSAPPATRLRLHMASNLGAVDVACREIRTLIEGHGLAAGGFGVEIVAREALCNAVQHGNRGDGAKRVRLDVGIGRRWIRLQVADDGVGFDWRRRSRAPDPTKTSGRGLALCSLYASRMAFNRSGTRITLWFEKPKGERPWPSTR
jgi:serine/threonine-protein kinase RsbW